MGLCALSPMAAEDRQQERVAEFVRYVITADLVKVREMITKHKMQPNAKDRFGMNAVHWAAYVGELVCIQELIKAGGSPSATDSNGRNALHHACRKDRDEVVRYLVTAANVDINSRSENQDTPLHKAVRGKGVKVLEALLKLGADPNLRNEQNRTPLEELEMFMPPPIMSEIIVSTGESSLMASARESARPEIYIEPLDFIGLALQPIRRGSGSRAVDHTTIRTFRSRHSVTDMSARTGRRDSTHEEPGKWATAPMNKPAALYVSVPVYVKEKTLKRKNLRWAGKRVIMALRMKRGIPDAEKVELMRLLLLKYTSAPDTTTP